MASPARTQRGFSGHLASRHSAKSLRTFGLARSLFESKAARTAVRIQGKSVMGEDIVSQWSDASGATLGSCSQVLASEADAAVTSGSSARIASHLRATLLARGFAAVEAATELTAVDGAPRLLLDIAEREAGGGPDGRCLQAIAVTIRLAEATPEGAVDRALTRAFKRRDWARTVADAADGCAIDRLLTLDDLSGLDLAQTMTLRANLEPQAGPVSAERAGLTLEPAPLRRARCFTRLVVYYGTTCSQDRVKQIVLSAAAETERALAGARVTAASGDGLHRTVYEAASLQQASRLEDLAEQQGRQVGRATVSLLVHASRTTRSAALVVERDGWCCGYRLAVVPGETPDRFGLRLRAQLSRAGFGRVRNAVAGRGVPMLRL